MNITKEYELEQEDCVKRNLKGYQKNIKDPVTLQRLRTLAKFIEGAPIVLSVGSGAHEPIYLNIYYAVDIPLCTYQLLKEQGWRGSFYQCSCDAMPFGYKFFDCAVCSEVIEHLPDLETVRRTFLEVNRVAKKWIFTTPTRDVKEPTHKFIFTYEQLADLARDLNATIEQKGLFFYIHNNDKKIFI